jgi:L-aminopeptidase/D-esterase-like protein
MFDPRSLPVSTGEATTIGLIVTDARLDKTQCRLVAESAHDGLARAIDPVHTAGDGDAFVAAATGRSTGGSGGSAGSVHVVRSLAASAVEAAVRDALA